MPPPTPPDLDRLPLEELARCRIAVAGIVAGLQESLATARGALARIDRAMLPGLADVSPHELVVDGHGFRAHRDGHGLHMRRPDGEGGP